MSWRAACVLTACGLAAGLLGPRLGVARAGPDPAPKRSPISITADALSIDTATRIVTATGNVRVTNGTMTASAGRATLYQAEGRAVLTDGPRVSGSQGVLEGAEVSILFSAKAVSQIVARGKARLEAKEGRLSAPTITLDPRTGAVSGKGGVSLLVPPDVVATGRDVLVERSRGFALLEGEARLQNKDGFVSGDRIEARERGQRATVTGSVLGRFRDIEVRSRTADVFGTDKKAVFAGEVEVTQPGRRMTTEKVTVWYEARRVVAEGQTRVRLEGQP